MCAHKAQHPVIVPAEVMTPVSQSLPGQGGQAKHNTYNMKPQFCLLSLKKKNIVNLLI